MAEYLSTLRKTTFLLSFLIILMPGCKSYDATLSYYDVNKPMQMGNFRSTIPLDTLDTIEAFLEVEVEDDTFSERENLSLTMVGGEYVSSNIDSVIVYTLNNTPTQFYGNTSIIVELKHGIKPGAMIFGLISGSITGNESEVGTYTIKRFIQKGTLYQFLRTAACYDH
jgi:hypothetical protein